MKNSEKNKVLSINKQNRLNMDGVLAFDLYVILYSPSENLLHAFPNNMQRLLFIVENSLVSIIHNVLYSINVMPQTSHCI